jgi:recombinational DNA repair protein RecR
MAPRPTPYLIKGMRKVSDQRIALTNGSRSDLPSLIVEVKGVVAYCKQRCRPLAEQQTRSCPCNRTRRTSSKIAVLNQRKRVILRYSDV